MSNQKSVKEKIIEAAGEVFLEKGFKGASIRDITDRAKVSVSALHYHFESKENLLGEIIASLGKEHLSFVQKTLKEPKSMEDFKARLEIFLEELIDLFRRNPTQTLILIKESDFTLPALGDALAFFREVHILLSQFFSQAQKSGYFTKSLPTDFVATFVIHHAANQFRDMELRKKNKKKTIMHEDYKKEWVVNTIRFMFDGCIQR